MRHVHRHHITLAKRGASEKLGILRGFRCPAKTLREKPNLSEVLNLGLSGRDGNAGRAPVAAVSSVPPAEGAAGAYFAAAAARTPGLGETPS